MAEVNVINGVLIKYLQEKFKNLKDDVEICDLLKSYQVRPWGRTQ